MIAPIPAVGRHLPTMSVGCCTSSGDNEEVAILIFIFVDILFIIIIRWRLN